MVRIVFVVVALALVSGVYAQGMQPVERDPRTRTSRPTAAMARYISGRLPAMVTSSTG